MTNKQLKVTNLHLKNKYILKKDFGEGGRRQGEI
jgi:hypothetical protein